jgi:hypothetical protein
MKGEQCFPFFDRFRVALVRGRSSVGSGRSELFIFDRTVGLLRANGAARRPGAWNLAQGSAATRVNGWLVNSNKYMRIYTIAVV